MSFRVEEAMNGFSRFIQSLLESVRVFLNSINYQGIFIILTIALLGAGCLAWLISNMLTLTSPNRFGTEHRGALNQAGRICYWMAVIIQLLFWLFGSSVQRALLRDVDFLTACVLAAIAVSGLLVSVILMIFPRKGTRVYVTRNINHSALSLLLMSVLLCIIAWFLLSN